MKRVGIKDIALSLNVSTATISVALTGKPGVSEALRGKIKEKAQEIGYVVNENARNLVKQESSKIGIFIYNKVVMNGSSYLYNVMQGIIYEASLHGISTIVYNGDKNLEVTDIINNIKKEYLKGIVILGVLDGDKGVQALEQQKLCPVVIFDFVAGGNINTITSSITEGIYKPLNYLKTLNHKKIAIFSGTKVAQINLLKMDEVAKYSKENPSMDIRSYYANYSPVEANEILSDILSGEWLPDAIFCLEDQMAIASMQKLAQHNIQVPEKISVIGFDDLIVSQYIGKGGLTSIRQNSVIASKQAVDIILNKAYSTHINNSIKLVTRGSCALK